MVVKLSPEFPLDPPNYFKFKNKNQLPARCCIWRIWESGFLAKNSGTKNSHKNCGCLQPDAQNLILRLPRCRKQKFWDTVSLMSSIGSRNNALNSSNPGAGWDRIPLDIGGSLDDSLGCSCLRCSLNAPSATHDSIPARIPSLEKESWV